MSRPPENASSKGPIGLTLQYCGRLCSRSRQEALDIGVIVHITAKLSVIIAAIFAIVCFSVAITGFVSLPEVTDATKKADGLGFAWFWTFLGSIAVVFGAVGVWIAKTSKDEEA